MKTSVTKSRKTVNSKVDKSLNDKYGNKVLFPKKLEKANAFVKRAGLPK